MNRGLAVLLAVSLFANVFLGGFVAGRLFGGPPPGEGGRLAAFSRHHPHPEPMPGAGGMMLPNLEALPAEKRALFRENFKERRDELRGNWTAVHERREAFAKALAADTWDRAKAEGALAALMEATNAQEALFSDLLIDSLESLSAEERKAVLKEGARRRPLRDRDGPPRRMPPPDEEGMGPPPPEE